MDQFEKKICKVFSSFYPFSKKDIKCIYDQLKSFDATLSIIQISLMCNVSAQGIINILKILKEE